MQMPRWLFSDSRYAGMSLEAKLGTVMLQDDPDDSSSPFVPPEEKPRTSDSEALDGPSVPERHRASLLCGQLPGILRQEQRE